MIDNKERALDSIRNSCDVSSFSLKFLDILMNFLDVLVKFMDILLGFSWEKDIAQTEAMPNINHFCTKSRSLMP